MTKSNPANYALARQLVESGRWRVDAEQGLVFGPKCQPFRHRNQFGYVSLKLTDPATRKLKYLMAHRVIWEAVHGPIEGDLQVNHMNGVKDDNRLANLELVTCSENHLHALRIGLRQIHYGQRCGSPLTTTQVLEIYRRAHSGTERQRDIAQEYGVTVSAVYQIKSGATYGYLTADVA